jgi:hypothetical protein
METSIFESERLVEAAAGKGMINKAAIIEIEINERIPLNNFAPVAISPSPNRFIIATCHQNVVSYAVSGSPLAHIATA